MQVANRDQLGQARRRLRVRAAGIPRHPGVGMSAVVRDGATWMPDPEQGFSLARPRCSSGFPIRRDSAMSGPEAGHKAGNWVQSAEASDSETLVWRRTSLVDWPV